MPECDEISVPVGFGEWSYGGKVGHITLSANRADLLALIREHIGSDRQSDRLNKEELAMIALDLGVVP